MLEDILEIIALFFTDIFGSWFNKKSLKEIILVILLVITTVALAVYYFGR